MDTKRKTKETTTDEAEEASGFEPVWVEFELVLELVFELVLELVLPLEILEVSWSFTRPSARVRASNASWIASINQEVAPVPNLSA